MTDAEKIALCRELKAEGSAYKAIAFELGTTVGAVAWYLRKGKLTPEQRRLENRKAFASFRARETRNTGLRPGWTDDEVAILVRCVADGMSAGVIADILKTKTRSSICGKCRRLGLKRTGVINYHKYLTRGVVGVEGETV